METKNSQYQASDEESVYGADNGAFYVGQGRDPRGTSTQSSYSGGWRQRRRRCACLCVGLRSYTWMCVAYNLFVNIIFSSFCWGLFSALVMLGGVLLPFCIGIVVFLATLQAARWFAQAELSIVNAFSPPEAPRAYRPNDTMNQENFKGWAIAVGCSGQSYVDLLCLWLIKLPFAFANCLISGLLIGLSGAAMSAPLVYALCDVCMKDGNLCFGSSTGDWGSEGTCHGWRVNTFGDSVGLCLLGAAVFVVTLHINIGLAALSMKVSRAMLSYQNSSESSARLLGQGSGPYCACPTSEHPHTHTHAPTATTSAPAVYVTAAPVSATGTSFVGRGSV